MTTEVNVKNILKLKEKFKSTIGHTRKTQGHLCILSLIFFFRDLCERLIIHFSFEMPIKIQFYILIVDFFSSTHSFPYLEFSHKYVFSFRCCLFPFFLLIDRSYFHSPV